MGFIQPKVIGVSIVDEIPIFTFLPFDALGKL